MGVTAPTRLPEPQTDLLDVQGRLSERTSETVQPRQLSIAYTHTFHDGELISMYMQVSFLIAQSGISTGELWGATAATVGTVFLGLLSLGGLAFKLFDTLKSDMRDIENRLSQQISDHKKQTHDNYASIETRHDNAYKKMDTINKSIQSLARAIQTSGRAELPLGIPHGWMVVPIFEEDQESDLPDEPK